MPGRPQMLSATVVSDSQVDLSWVDNSNNEDGFRIERCIGNGCGDFTTRGQVTANVTVFSDTGLAPATVYRYRVIAFNGSGDSMPSNRANATTLDAGPPIAPAGLSATAIAFDEISLSWSDNSDDEDGFRVLRCSGPGCSGFSQIAQLGQNTTAFSDGGLMTQTTYRYQVVAFSGAGDSAPSNIAEDTTPSEPLTPPAAPSVLSATAVSMTQIDLAWADNADNESGFRIFRCTGSGCSGFAQVGEINSPDATSFGDSGLTAGVTYRYQVRTFNGAGQSAPSNTAEATTPSIPTAPTGLNGTAVSPSQIDLAWNDNSDNEDGFRIFRCEGSGCGGFAQVGQVGADVTAFADNGLHADTLYRYRVLAFNVTGESSFSNDSQATTLSVPPAAPSSLNAGVVSPTQIDLSWFDNADNEDGFRVFRCSGSGCGSFSQVAQLGANSVSYSDSGLAPNTTYRYQVRAFNGEGDSAPSNTAEATTLAAGTVPLPPTGLTVAAVTENQINLIWFDQADDEDGFRVFRCSGSSCGAFVEVGQVGPNTVAFSDTGLPPQETFRYQVRAFNASGESTPSNTVEAATLASQSVPATPGPLTALGVSDSQVDLNWIDNAENEEGFRIFRCTGAACSNFAPIAEAAIPDQTSFSDTGLEAEMFYRYQVRAFNQSGESPPSNTAQATTLTTGFPVPPTDLSAIAVSASQIDLDWLDNSENEQGFRISRCVGEECNNFEQIAEIEDPDVETFSDIELLQGTTYRYIVSAFNGLGSSAPSNVAEAKTFDTPVPPSNLRSAAVSLSEIDLFWIDNSEDELGFRIFRCQGEGCENFAQVRQLGPNISEFNDTGLQEETVYRYFVVAFNAVGESAPTNIAERATLPRPGAPEGLLTTAVSSSQIELKWTDTSFNEDGFWIFRCTGPGCANRVSVAEIAAPNVTTYNDTGLAPRTTYRYQLMAFNDIGDSPLSNLAEAETFSPDSVPESPRGLAANAVSAFQIDLIWQDHSSDEDGFRIRRCAGQGCSDFSQVAITILANVNSFVDKSVAAGTIYRYQVVAYNNIGNSRPSNTAEALTQAAPSPELPAALTFRWIDDVSSTLMPGDFIDVVRTAVGRVHRAQFEIRNAGTETAIIDSIAIFGSAFTVVRAPALPLELRPDRTARLEVWFQPRALGRLRGILDVGHRIFELRGVGTLSGANITGVPDIVAAGAQVGVGVRLNPSIGQAVGGELRFNYLVAEGSADPAVRFASGGERVEFQLDAGQQQATFALGNPQAGFQAGRGTTLAGRWRPATSTRTAWMT